MTSVVSVSAGVRTRLARSGKIYTIADFCWMLMLRGPAKTEPAHREGISAFSGRDIGGAE
jgi:hypothetical protein